MSKRRPSLSFQQRLKISKEFEEKNRLGKRKSRLYNRIYRKSVFFISAWVIRMVFISLFFIIIVFYTKTDSVSMEVTRYKNLESYYTSSRYRQRIPKKELRITTDKDNYILDISDMNFPSFAIGDTLLIDRNFFGKPIYLTKENWYRKYSLPVNFYFYFLAFFVTGLSLTFNNGLDRFTSKILWATMLLDVFSLICFFYF